MPWKTRVEGSPNQIGKAYPERESVYPYGARRRGSGTVLAPQERSVDQFKKPGMTQEEYGNYVAGSLHDGHGKKATIVRINKPAHQIDLHLTTVNVDQLEPTQRSPDVEKRSEYFVDAIQRGKTIPPILVHRLPDGTYQIVDGHARVKAYQKLGITTVPAVENGLTDVLASVGAGIGRAAKKTVVEGARALGEARRAYAEGRKGTKPRKPRTQQPRTEKQEDEESLAEDESWEQEDG